MTLLKTEPICFKCKHFNNETSLCPAFGEKDIPDEIIFGENNHEKPLNEQKNNLVFAPIK